MGEENNTRSSRRSTADSDDSHNVGTRDDDRGACSDDGAYHAS